MTRTPEQREYIDNVRSTEQLEWPLAVVTTSPCSMDATRMGIVFVFQVESIEMETPVLSRCASTPVLNGGSALPVIEGESTPVLDLSHYPGGSSCQVVVNESLQRIEVGIVSQRVMTNEQSNQVTTSEQPKPSTTNEQPKPINSPEAGELAGVFQSSNPIDPTESSRSSKPVDPTNPTNPLPSSQSSPSTPSKPLKRTSSQAPILASIPLFFSQEPVVVPTLDESGSEEKKSRLSLPSDLVRLSLSPHL